MKIIFIYIPIVDIELIGDNSNAWLISKQALYRD